MLKEKSKILIIALLLSLIFSVGAVAAAEDMTFDQSNTSEVPLGASVETPDTGQDVDVDVSPVSSNEIVGGGQMQMTYYKLIIMILC